MEQIGSFYNQYLAPCYSSYGMNSNLEKFFPGKAPYKYRSIKPSTYPIAYLGNHPLMVDDPRVIRICFELARILPKYDTSNSVPYTAQNWKSILGDDYSKMYSMINVPPTPAGYFLSKFEDTRKMEQREILIATRVAEKLFPKNYLDSGDLYSFLKKDSSVGIPFHNNNISTKILSLQLGYKVIWEMSEYKEKKDPTILQFNHHLFETFHLLNTYKLGTRGQLDKPTKVRTDFTADGREVEVNKSVSQFTNYHKTLITECTKQFPRDGEFLDYIRNDMTTRRFRTIMIMPAIGGILSFVQRALIQYRKKYFRHLVDQGSDYNIAALVSEKMVPKENKVRDTGQYFFLGTDAKNFDRSWHSMIHKIGLKALDEALPKPFNIMFENGFGANAITNASNRKDAITPAYITHNNMTYDGSINVIGLASGSPLTKALNDYGSTCIIENICDLAGFGSFIEHSSNNTLMTNEFPISALVNGDDIMLCVKGRDNLNRLLRLGLVQFGLWQSEFDKVPMWNNQKITVDDSGYLRFIKNHENIAEKIFKPEHEFGKVSTGSEKTLPNYGYHMRKLEYDTPEGREIFDIMNDISEKYLGKNLDQIFTLTDKEKEFLDTITEHEEATNILEFLADPEKLQYLSRLDEIPEDWKKLYYFQLNPEMLKSIIRRDDKEFLGAIKNSLAITQQMTNLQKKLDDINLGVLKETSDEIPEEDIS